MLIRVHVNMQDLALLHACVAVILIDVIEHSKLSYFKRYTCQNRNPLTLNQQYMAIKLFLIEKIMLGDMDSDMSM